MNTEHHQEISSVHEEVNNSWSKYQLLVLQQLDDHNAVLQNLNKEVVEIKQFIAVLEAEYDMWKEQISLEVKDCQKHIDDILHNERGIGQRLNLVERNIEIEERTATRTKATWALYGSITMFVANLIVQIIIAYLKSVK